MELHIIDYGWGINRKTGERDESIVADVRLGNLKKGPLAPVGPARHVFEILEIEEDAITILLSQKAGSVKLEKGKPYEYRPFTMDGGHFYRLELE